MTPFNLVLYLFCSLIVPLLVSWYVCPQVVRLAKQKNLTDIPGARKLQSKPVPVVGGISLFTSIVISLALFFPLSTLMGYSLVIHPSCLISLSLVFLVGFFDDMVDIRASYKFIFQFLAILLLCYGGYIIDTFNGLFGVYHLPKYLAVPLSLFAGVGIMNAINMVDGVNGLSSGFGITFSLVFSIFLFHVGDYANAALAMMFIGALLPFFIANGFSYKYKMFIGDSGALMLGVLAYMLVCSVLRGGGTVQSTSPDTYHHSVALVMSILSIPVFDTLRVMTMRMLNGKSPFHADKTHLHHILLDLNLPHLGVTLSILALNTVVMVAWLLTNYWVHNALLQWFIVVLVAILCSWVVYAVLWICREKHYALFQKLITHYRERSRFIRTASAKVEFWYDALWDRRGYHVPEFDFDRVNVSESLSQLPPVILQENKQYQEEDMEKVLKYIASFTVVEVEDIIVYFGDKELNIYPMLFTLEQYRVIQVLRRNATGLPLSVKYNCVRKF